MIIETLAAAALVLPTTPEPHRLGDYYGLKTVAVEIAGRPRRFVLDTGAGVTVLTPEVAQEAGCRPWGQLVGYRLTGEQVRMTRCDDLPLSVEGDASIWPRPN